MTIVDHYQNVENGLATKLRTLTDLFEKPWQVSDDDTVLAKGADNFIVYRPGSFPVTKVSDFRYDVDWNITADLYVRYKTYRESWANFRRARAAIIDLIFTHPRLGGVAYYTIVSSGEGALYFKFEENASVPNFIIQTLTFTIRQHVIFEDKE